MSIKIPIILVIPALVWGVTYLLTKYHGIHGVIKEFFDFNMWGDEFMSVLKKAITGIYEWLRDFDFDWEVVGMILQGISVLCWIYIAFFSGN